MDNALRTTIELVGKDAGATKLLADTTKGLGGLTRGLLDVGKAAVGFAVGAGLAQLPGFLLDAAKGAAEDQAATDRLAQSIRNLGGPFDEQMALVNDAIAAGQKLAFTDDQVRNSFQFLAAATGSSSEALKRQRLAMDVARGAGISLEAATKLVGKVNEENVQTFRRMGIVIKEDASEAEALAAIQAKFANQADVYAKSTAGQWEQAQIAFSEVVESIGGALLPVLTKVGTILSDNLPAIQAFVGTLAGGIAETVGPAVERLFGTLQGLVGWLTTGDLGWLDDSELQGIAKSLQGVRDTLAGLFESVMAVLPDVGIALRQVFAFFTTGGGDIEVFRGVLNRLVGPEGAQKVVEVFANVTGFVHNVLIPALRTAGEIVNKVLAGDLSGALSQVGAIVKAVAPQIGAALVEWGRQFIEFIGPLIPPLLAELARLGQQVIAWLVAEVPEIMAVLAQWGRELWAWIGPMIPPLLVELGKVGLALLTWLGQQIPPLVAQFAAWAKEFVVWIAPMVPPFLAELALFGLRVAKWLGEQALVLAVKFYTDWLPAFVNWINDVLPEAEKRLNDFKTALGTWIVNDAAPFIGKKALEIGKAIIQGIWDGQLAMRDWLIDKVTGLLSSLLAAAKSRIQAFSPSQVWADEIGAPIVQGIIEGINSLAPDLNATVQMVLEEMVDVATEAAADMGTPIRQIVDLIDNELTPAFDLFAHEIIDPLAERWGRFTNLTDEMTRSLIDLKNTLVNLPALPNFPGVGGGGGGGLPGIPHPGEPGGGGGLQPAGATALASAGGVVWTGNVIVYGDVLTEGQLIDKIHAALAGKAISNNGLGIRGMLS